MKKTTFTFSCGATVAALALTAGALLFPASPALADDQASGESSVSAGNIKFPDPQKVVFPDPQKVVFSVESEDGAVSTANTGKEVKTTLSGDVNFESDSDKLTDRAKQILDNLAAEWAKKKPSAVNVTGHTDSVEDDAHNMDLSKRRAKAVGDYLATKVQGLKVVTEGKGETTPIADNDSDAGKAKNRRVEILATP
ncbi:MAG: OmpA family protein [Actinomycetaceae bacterium]|nr:OmpA family protein [Actinomycetaceae bacterium]